MNVNRLQEKEKWLELEFDRVNSCPRVFSQFGRLQTMFGKNTLMCVLTCKHTHKSREKNR